MISLCTVPDSCRFCSGIFILSVVVLLLLWQLSLHLCVVMMPLLISVASSVLNWMLYCLPYYGYHGEWVIWYCYFLPNVGTFFWLVCVFCYLSYHMVVGMFFYLAGPVHYQFNYTLIECNLLLIFQN